MPGNVDAARIREILLTDRAWAVYALADLAPEYSMHAHWVTAPEGHPALLLIYRGFQPPVLFAHGATADLAGLITALAQEPEFYLSVRPDFLALMTAAGYRIRSEKRMWRMLLDAREFEPAEAKTARLGPGDLDDLQHLYCDGEAAGEAPLFFDPSMLSCGVYYGVREDGSIVAAAGTHVLATDESIAAIGNVYTRRDRRGRGLGTQAASAVAGELLRLGIQTIALNVEESNIAAGRIYSRLGFRRYCAYREGAAIRVDLNGPSARAR
ncbi:MAG TPA: GNAT family N-acetyltransferase [Bryobacteraceae bacterium]|nr:GNAT family N-acetyltransferase [Bryobacteraceae bacterium]